MFFRSANLVHFMVLHRQHLFVFVLWTILRVDHFDSCKLCTPSPNLEPHEKIHMAVTTWTVLRPRTMCLASETRLAYKSLFYKPCCALLTLHYYSQFRKGAGNKQNYITYASVPRHVCPLLTQYFQCGTGTK